MESTVVNINVPRAEWVYPIVVIIGAAVGLASRRFTDVPSLLPAKIRWECVLLILLAALIGAYSVEPLSRLWGANIQSGRSMLSALLFGWLGAEVIKRVLGIKGSIGDEFALPLAIAFTAGRIGCIFAHCCDGAPVSGFLVFTYNGAPFFPTGVYESMFHFLWAVLLLSLTRSGLLAGQHLRIYLGTYCLFRLITEFWRGNPTNLFGLTLFQALSIIFICVILGTVFLERRT